MRRSKSVEMRGRVVHWDGQVGTIQTTNGAEVKFLPLHLIANGYIGRLRVGDIVYFTCTVIEGPEYFMETIRAVSLRDCDGTLRP